MPKPGYLGPTAIGLFSRSDFASHRHGSINFPIAGAASPSLARDLDSTFEYRHGRNGGDAKLSAQAGQLFLTLTTTEGLSEPFILQPVALSTVRAGQEQAALVRFHRVHIKTSQGEGHSRVVDPPSLEQI